MPIYEYKCDKCGNVFEVIQKFSDVPVAVHEGCGGAVERLISTSALQFKGSGFYITDYAKSGSSSAPPKGDSKSDAKSDSKSDSKSGGSTPSTSTSSGDSKGSSSSSSSSSSSTTSSDSK